ncbi:hypothetical protein [Paramagnetospirillum kuznetsovii]|uniref:hypothetical protein n=1 Tax=Paramagnetospirillum kuznetsovii TaxID=2053833 RepID=UPI001961A4EB|nr:hypothetical protein [Paramagnetospirillum kuznetsovii]
MTTDLDKLKGGSQALRAKSIANGGAEEEGLGGMRNPIWQRCRGARASFWNLSRKRSLTMEMAWKLNRKLGIPAESLLRPNPPEPLKKLPRPTSRGNNLRDIWGDKPYAGPALARIFQQFVMYVLITCFS